MSNLSISRLFGIALIAGGTIVGLLIMVLMSNYASDGKFTTASATLAVIAAFILLVLPQIGLGIYLIWDSMRETAVIPPENSPPTK
jgi:hypothetical protein